jgi:predicted nucleic acid-binding protein
MSYLLDADWIIQILSGDVTAISVVRRLRGSRFAVCWIAVAEVYEGAFATPAPETALINARQFVSSYPIVDFDGQVAERFALERAHLRRHGQLSPDMDLLIAATALTHDLTLLTFNRRHFRRIPNLKMYVPSAI